MSSENTPGSDSIVVQFPASAIISTRRSLELNKINSQLWNWQAKNLLCSFFPGDTSEWREKIGRKKIRLLQTKKPILAGSVWNSRGKTGNREMKTKLENDVDTLFLYEKKIC